MRCLWRRAASCSGIERQRRYTSWLQLRYQTRTQLTAGSPFGPTWLNDNSMTSEDISLRGHRLVSLAIGIHIHGPVHRALLTIALQPAWPETIDGLSQASLSCGLASPGSRMGSARYEVAPESGLCKSCRHLVECRYSLWPNTSKRLFRTRKWDYELCQCYSASQAGFMGEGPVGG